ncbi:two-component regulator propeller domain-containing protein [Massilia sp. TS11]|uniref:two-component regulator propeller domain-containing protein n=1 Tax=Massilia sp. TS11 TaxID=2908003 RepID=UPI001EDBD034|nr:two-component regulator propeller domain-containing protein [Massilia sp. TS11]MCG2584466.1 ATP-binding protein [Massilia sp. TS11]
MRWLRSLCVLCFVLLGCWSQAATPPSRSLRFERMGVEQGLAQESVLTVLQDRQGFMWFGTQAGLTMADGYQTTIFKNDPSDPASLVDNYVLASYEDGQGRLWFGTKGGLVVYLPATRKFQRFLPDADAAGVRPNRTVSAITGDGAGGLWLASGDGLKHLDPASGKFTSLRHESADAQSLSDDRVNALLRTAEGDLWVGTASGLDWLPKGAQRFRHIDIEQAATGGKQTAVQSLALLGGAAPVLWVGTSAGLQAFALKPHGPQRQGATQLPGQRILSLLHDREQRLWIGTDNQGLFWRHPESGALINYRNQPLDLHALSDNQISAIYQDRTGTLWVGTWYAGVNRVDLASGGFERVSFRAGESGGLSNSKVKAVADAGAGKLWLATSGGGLNRYDPASGTSEVWRAAPGKAGALQDDLLTTVEPGAHGSLWVGSQTGLARFDPARASFTMVPLSSDPNANYIQRVYHDRAGYVWVVTRGGLHQLDADGHMVKTWRHDPRDPSSLGDNWGFFALEDREGNFWIGTDNGLDRMDRAGGRFRHYRHDPANPASLSHSRVHWMLQARDGTLWAGTAGGLNRVSIDAQGEVRFQHYSLSNGSMSDPIGAVLEDSSGQLWISTTAGLVRFDPRSGRFKQYTSRDGLIDGSFFVGSGFAGNDGSLYFGGLNGLLMFRPGAIHDNPHPPAVAITDFLVSNHSIRNVPPLGGELLSTPIAETREIALSYLNSVFSFEFAALHFADPARNRYAYQLEGFDREWVTTDASKRFATYTNLDPGRYVFRVRAANKDGVWNETGARLEVVILPPFWRTWWFRLMLVALVLGSAYVIYRLRVRALLAQQHRLEEEVGARTEELVRQNASVERQKAHIEQAHRNISLLSEIGRTLTAKLDYEQIMLILYDRVNALMDAHVFGIGFYRPELELIEYPFAIEMGKRYAPYTRSMREPNQLGVWCITHNREVFINNLDADYKQYIDHLDYTSSPEDMGTLDDGTLPTVPHSMLYVPIVVGERVLGVISVHSYRENAYQGVHLDMLRTLASYVGVAFDNADAYRQLKDTQQQLVAQEKMAALGSLVAGVAHELNTPIGNSLLMASTLQERTTSVGRLMEAGTIKRSDLSGFIAAAQEATTLIMRSLRSAADLVNSFKQVAVDQASAQRRKFNLAQTCGEIAATMANAVRKAGHSLTLDIPERIEMESYPGPLGQVIINLINNALLHAFDERKGGHIQLSASQPSPERVLIVFSDDGCGIPRQHLARIFDPFFTTKMGQGGSGLGLNITYNIVTGLLGGSIRVESAVGSGTSFFLDIALQAPVQSAPEA